MSVIALIPARVGSKGIPGKNFRRLGDCPLWWHAFTVAVASGADTVMVSSDRDPPRWPLCDDGLNCERHFWRMRPPALAQDDSPMIDVVRDALKAVPGEPDDIWILLQPTQPFRTPAHVQTAIHVLQESGADSVVSVTELPANHSPEVALRRNAGGFLRMCSPDFGCDLMDLPTRRQDIGQWYVRDGTVYAFWRRTVDTWRSIYGLYARPLIIPPEETCELDTEADWAEVERRWAQSKPRST